MGRGAIAGVAAVALAAVAALGAASPAPAEAARGMPPIKHVFTIVLENKNYSETFGEQSAAPYLAHRLTAKGQLLTEYHGTGHFSLGNYITMISGQSENPATQADCPSFDQFSTNLITTGDQALGIGCVYPSDVGTVAGQLTEAGYSWRGYMQDMGDDLERDRTRRCSHPEIGTSDHTQEAAPTDQYATRHNPFVYFHSVIDNFAYCKRHVVNLDRLRHDLEAQRTTRNYTFITPDLCADGHDEVCVNPRQPGGYAGIDDFLRRWVPRILRSDAFRRDGLLIVTFDESESGAEACCFVPLGPSTPLQGIYGPGGGRTGTVLISRFIEPGSVNDHPYNHYDYLHAIEDIFGLGYLGYAGNPAVESFGADVFGG